MFTDREVDSYRNLKAPDSLRQKITGSHKSYKKTIGFITAVAACFVLIISGIAINNQGNIVVNGQKLNDSVEFYCVASAMEKSVSSTVIVPIQFNVRDDTKILVLDGKISIDGSDSSKEMTITSPKEILWEVEPQEAQCEFEMFITDKKGVQKVTLQYDNTKVTVTKEKEK